MTAFPTLSVTDAAGTTRTVNTLPNAGEANAASSLPVVLASDDPAVALLTSIANNNTPAIVVGVTSIVNANFTRPANTTAYSAGQLVANSTSAGSVVPMQFTVAQANGGSGMIRKARMRKNGTTVLNAIFRLHLFSVTPGVSTATDGGAITAVTGVANYVGAFDISCDRAFGDGAVGGGGAHTGAEVNYVCAVADTKLYGLLEMVAGTGYVPNSGEVFNIDLEVLPNG